MKRIAVFCDGTWNSADAAFSTNVHQLWGAISETDSAGIAQKAEYIPGVGTGHGKKGLSKRWDKIVGGAFGVGVTRNIMRAYQFLAETYEPGDQIYIFGFSRGAFTARSLAGLLRASGLPSTETKSRMKHALNRYRSMNPKTAPGTEESHRFRAEYSPNVATSEAEQTWRRENNLPEGALLSITYLGIWDTVGALGVPGHYKFLARLFNGNYGFHDLILSRSVDAARHAVSIDETRRTFPPSLWENLGDLNQSDDEAGRNYRQQWFPGDHGSVGGGGDIRGLSSIALLWVAEGAQAAGLEIDPNALESFADDEDITAPLNNQTKPPGFIGRLMRKSKLHRVGKYGPKFIWDVSKPARDRWKNGDLHYRPPPLKHLEDELNG